jgi:hypothetical protein
MPTSQRNKITPDRSHIAIGEENAVKYLVPASRSQPRGVAARGRDGGQFDC